MTSTCSPGRRPTSQRSRSTATPLPQGYDDHAAAWTDVRRALAAAARPTVPCNNDLLAANFIDDGRAVCRLIDYEYSGNNDACFELGNTTTECDFTPEQVEAYTEAYFGTPTRADLARVRLQTLVSEYGWSLWGFIQAAASPIDYDFHGWGMERYEKAAATFRGPDLAGLLEEVAPWLSFPPAPGWSSSAAASSGRRSPTT